MSGTKRISALTELASTSVAGEDILAIVDMSQASVTDKTKHITVDSLLGGANTDAKVSFKTVALLLADTTRIGYSGARFNVAEGDIVSAGGFRYEVAASDASDHHLVTAGGVKLYVMRDADGFYHGMAFGALHDGSTDDSAAYAAAFAAAEAVATSYGTAGVYVDQGITVWNTGIVAQLSGNHFTIKGAGRRSSVIRAGGAITMLTVGQSSGVFSRVVVSGIGFDQDDTATCALDMTYCRYCVVTDSSFAKPATSGKTLKIGRWVNRVFLNELTGLQSDGTTRAGMPIEIPNETTNDFQIMFNSFSNFDKPLTCLSVPHDMKIDYNTFDFMAEAAIFLASGGRNISISSNYFEQCGSDSVGGGVDIAAVGGGTANYSATIVGTWLSSSTSELENLIIEKNQFANNYGTALGIFSGVKGLIWRDNHALRNYSYDYCVRFVESVVGTSTQAVTRILIDQNNYNSQFTQLVGLGGASSENSHNGLQIIERKDFIRNIVHGGYDLVPRDLTDTDFWTAAGGATVAQNGFFEGREPIYEIDASGTLSHDIVFDANNSGWKGTYIRCGYLNKGDVGDSNGVRLRVYTDTGSGYTNLIGSSSRAAEDVWTAGGRNMTLYIPTNAVGVRFQLDRIGGSGSGFITHFHIDSAAVDLRR